MCAEDISAAFESIAHRIIELYSELSFECDGFAMPELVKSYLDRKSFVSDRSSDEMMEVYRTFLDQTSPQGSSNSPAWWRVYDGGFTKIFVELVDNMCENDDRIYDFKHVSYADDKLCCYTLDLDKFVDDESVQEAIKEISGKNRDFLMEATSTFGCAVNEDKSEVLVPVHLQDKEHKPKLKKEMVWLGYSLEIENNYFQFTKTRMINKFATVSEKFSRMCQYIKSINVKRKIFEVYIKPVIDWFIPTILTGKWHALSQANEIEKFQQKCLSIVAGICGRVCRTQLNRKLGFHSVYETCTITARRLTKFFPRDVVYLKSENTLVNMRLRSSTIMIGETWHNCDHFDLGDRCHYLANCRKVLSTLKFSSLETKLWRIRRNKIIRRKINERKSPN